MSQGEVSTETLASIGVASVLALGVFAWALSRDDKKQAFAADEGKFVYARLPVDVFGKVYESDLPVVDGKPVWPPNDAFIDSMENRSFPVRVAELGSGQAQLWRRPFLRHSS